MISNLGKFRVHSRDQEGAKEGGDRLGKHLERVVFVNNRDFVYSGDLVLGGLYKCLLDTSGELATEPLAGVLADLWDDQFKGESFENGGGALA